MKKFYIALCFIVLNGCVSLNKSAGIRFAKYQDLTLSNGLKVLIVENKNLPVVQVGLLIRTGASSDPISKSGLASLTTDLLDQGTKLKTSEQLADEFGNLGTSFNGSVNADFIYLSTKGLSKNQNELLKLFFEVVTQPAFSPAEVNRMSQQNIADIQRAYDQPPYLASRFFAQMLFSSHPYGRPSEGTVRDIKGIRQSEITQLYSKYFRPNNSLLVFVGDIAPDFKNTIIELTKDWKPEPIKEIDLGNRNQLSGQRIMLVNREDLKQAEVRMGHYGIQRKIEDYQTLKVAETILSSGFTSRLMNEIRVKRGLTYGINTNFDAKKDVGSFSVTTNTRFEKVGETVGETLKVIRAFYDKGVSEDELSMAKGFLRGAFPRGFETPEQLAQTLVALRFFEIDDSYLTNYLENLEKIKVSDVNEVIKKYYHPDQMQILVYAPKEKVIDQLRPLGAIELKNYLELF
ncbi:MAG: pitrilysin family protein [Bdellovibrionales bacterium]